MNKKINKYGLDRYVPLPIREQIRKDAGYGCVICGSLFGDYEHIEPEFFEAREHDPDKMTYLCVRCHPTVTRGRRSKSSIWKAKANPKSKSTGFVSDFIYPDHTEPNIVLGSSNFQLTTVIINVYGKPLLWFEKPSIPEEPILINAIFYDDKSSPVAFINRNQFIGFLGTHDISGEGATITIRPQKGIIGLEFESSDGKPIVITRLSMTYLDTKFEVKRDGSFLIKQGNSCITLQSTSMIGCGTGIKIGDIPKSRISDNLGILTRVFWALFMAHHKPAQLVDFTGSCVGWVFNNRVINKDYCITGIIDGRSVSSITGEYIGETKFILDKVMIVHEQPEHKSMEPIWSYELDKSTFNVKSYKGYDLSYRLAPSIYNSYTPSPTPTEKTNSIHTSMQPSWIEENKAAENGDRVTINFIGYINGVEFDGGRANNFTLILGNNRMIPGFEDALTGKLAGDIFDIHIKFPSDYHAENLRGKEAIFNTEILKIESQKCSA